MAIGDWDSLQVNLADIEGLAVVLKLVGSLVRSQKVAC